jgi:multicomponent Na+:H+ antiporter subunit C
MELLPDVVLDRYVYVLVLTLLAVGLYGMLAKRNLVQKVIGMTIYTTAIYLFFIEGSVKEGAHAPIISEELGGSDAALYVDPLPHLLILTAIVVGVGILGVGLALLVRIHRIYGTLDEDELVAILSAPESATAPHDPESDLLPGDERRGER